MSAETDLQAAIGKAALIAYDIEAFATGGTYTGDRTAALTAIINDASPGQQNAIEAVHSAIQSLRGAYGPLVAWGIPAYQRIKGWQEPSLDGMLFRLFEYAGGGGFTIKSRGFTFASPSAGSNTGTGAVTRLTTDRFSYPIECGTPEAKTWKCVADEHSGAQRHQEQFLIQGTPPSRTVFPWPSAGTSALVNALSIRDSQSLVQNPGFEQYDSTNGFTGWTLSSGSWGTDVVSDSTNYYKDVLPQTSPLGLKFATAGTRYIYQTWSANALRWSPYVPLYAQIAWMRLGSATGTLKLKIGAIEVTVDISTGTNGVWNILRWPAGSPNQNAWFRQWNAISDAATPPSAPFVKITIDSLAVGTCVIDDFIIGPWSRQDGTWHAIVGGVTPFKKDDIFTGTDTATEAAKLQTAFVKGVGGNFYLPAVGGGAQTWAEP